MSVMDDGESFHIAPSVAVAIIFEQPHIYRRPVGSVLITQRLPSAFEALRWEFPGGSKLDSETIFEACKREVKEELGIEVIVKRLYWIELAKRVHGEFNLYFILCELPPNQYPRPVDCYALTFATIGEIEKFDFCDMEIVAKLKEDFRL